MNLVALTFSEIKHRWKSSLLVASIVAFITAALTYFMVNDAGFQKEVSRNVRDIGSNVVILPADVDQTQYHSDGGYSNVTMSTDLVQQLIEYKASLNHLIPMLEQRAECSSRGKQTTARIVGIAASIPMPGRPKSPMQKSIPEEQVQLGAKLAEKLEIGRDEKPEFCIGEYSFVVNRVNAANGTWQDGAAFLDLTTAQRLFELPNKISRIEAIECTDEQCASTGLTSSVVLSNELARITDQATILRRDQMANARSKVRHVSHENQQLLQNMLWVLLALIIMGLASLNSYQRKSEVGVLQALGYGTISIVTMFVSRAMALTVLGALVGITVGGIAAQSQGQPLFQETGTKFAVDWNATIMIGVIATILAGLASALPAVVAAMKHPAEIIGKDV